MKSFVLGWGECGEVFDSVVELVFVSVVDLVSVGHGTVVAFPYFDVLEHSGDIVAAVAFSRDVIGHAFSHSQDCW